MICNRTETGWEIVYQRAHALLAAQLLAPWQPSGRPERWTELLTATAQHDNGWQEWEPGQRLTPLGTPLHFTETPQADRIAQSERALERAWHQSTWSGLLVAAHIAHLYRTLDDAPTRALLSRLAEAGRRWRRALGVRQRDVQHAYQFLLWGDTFSLVVACGQLPFGERRIEIEPVDGVRYDAWQRADGSLGVDPWPYEVETFEVTLDTYSIHRLTFASEAELAGALEQTAPVEKRWVLSAGR